MSELLNIRHLSIAYSDLPVIRDVSFSLQQGDIACLLGPSGCGKTTLLRSIAGFQAPERGSISIKGKRFSDHDFVLPPERRRIGMVFQDFALFPHLTVFNNLAFGLRHAAASKESIRQRVEELLVLVGLPDKANCYPYELSGGQQQRVALARALAPKPDLLLLDEPFSSLDVELRRQLTREVRHILKSEQTSAIMVTHDQHEAFAMADYVGLILDGKLAQWDSAYNIYHRPASREVADFIGDGVMIPGTVVAGNAIETELGLIKGAIPDACETGEVLDVLIRPDDVLHDDDSRIQLEVYERVFRGADFLYTLKLPSGCELKCIAPSHHNHELGTFIGVRLEIEHVVAFRR